MLVGCVLLAAELPAQEPPPTPQQTQPQTKPQQAPEPPGEAQPPRIYGVEVESSPARDRVLVFADGPVRPQLEEANRGTVVLVFPGAVLDPSAPRRVPTDPGGAVPQAGKRFL